MKKRDSSSTNLSLTMAPSRSLLLSTLVIIVLVSKASSKIGSGPKFFSTRTLYEAAHGTGVSKQSGCSPVALWALVRSGVSYPNAEEIRQFSKFTNLRERILDNHENWKSGNLSKEILESLRNWSFKFDPSKADSLAESGISDLTSLIQRLQSQFPRLLHPAASYYHNIRHNREPKASQTADIIASTLYNTTIKSPLPGTSDFTEILGQSCASWLKILKAAEARAKEFREAEVTPIVQTISRKLGFSRLSYDVIRDAYKLCSYDRSISSNRSSPWCSIFTPSDLEAFEYEEDILSYYTSGPGNPNVAQIGCDFIRVFLQNFAVHKTNANVNIQVTSDLLIRTGLSSLGVAANDPPLTAANFANNKGRIWRNAYLTPYSGNVLAVLNECGNSLKHFHTVSVYVNEIPITFPFCGGEQFCEVFRFQRQYSSITNLNFCRKNIC